MAQMNYAREADRRRMSREGSVRIRNRWAQKPPKPLAVRRYAFPAEGPKSRSSSTNIALAGIRRNPNFL